MSFGCVFDTSQNRTILFSCQPGETNRPVPAATVAVDVGDFWFCDPAFQGGVCETTINAGDSVYWNFSGPPPGIPPGSITHTSTECGSICWSVIPDPESRLWHAKQYSRFTKRFNTPGTYQYQCNTHPNLMRGTIIVRDLNAP